MQERANFKEVKKKLVLKTNACDIKLIRYVNHTGNYRKITKYLMTSQCQCMTPRRLEICSVKNAPGTA